jgi:ComF family protein
MSEALGARLPVYPWPTLRERLLDEVFPPLCVGCRRAGRWICDRCWPKVPWLDPPYPVPLPPGIAGVVAVAEHDGVAREAVHALKFGERHAIASMMGRLMAAAVAPHEVHVVAPVPLHPARRRERGYDQAGMLAAHVARALETPCRKGLIRRTRRTRQQVSLDGIQRQENVRGAFAPRERLQGETVLLVDDVLTTGATMSAAASAAREAGAGSVIACVFAWAR